MKYTLLAAGVTAVLLAVAGIVAGGKAAPAPASKGGDRWEYAELHAYHYPGGSNNVGQDIPVKATIRWTRAKITVEASAVSTQHNKRKPDGKWVSTLPEVAEAAWGNMAKKLNAQAADKGDSETTRRMKLFDSLGEQGWELVVYHPRHLSDEDLGTQTVWIFKRKAR
jgi:hypothetical protein